MGRPGLSCGHNEFALDVQNAHVLGPDFSGFREHGILLIDYELSVASVSVRDLVANRIPDQLNVVMSNYVESLCLLNFVLSQFS